MLSADELGHLGAGRVRGAQALQILLAPDVLANRDELHLRRHEPAARVMHLGDGAARARAAGLALQVETHLGELRVIEPLTAVARARPGELPGVAALLDPRPAQGREALADVDPRLG